MSGPAAIPFERGLAVARELLTLLDGTSIPWPLGCAIGIVEVVDCQQAQLLAPSLSQMEIDFGDYRQFGDDDKQRYGIVTVNPRPFPKPIPFRGQQGFFPFPDALIPKEVLYVR